MERLLRYLREAPGQGVWMGCNCKFYQEQVKNNEGKSEFDPEQRGERERMLFVSTARGRIGKDIVSLIRT